MPGYPCCCTIVTACQESDDFATRTFVNSPVGTWCLAGSYSTCFDPATYGVDWYINSDGKLVAKINANIAHKFQANRWNQYDASVNVLSKTTGRTFGLGQFVYIDSSSPGGFVTPHTTRVGGISLDTTYTIRVIQCSGVDSMTGLMYNEVYLDGTKMSMGLAGAYAHPQVGGCFNGTTPLVSGNTLSAGGVGGGSGTFDNFSIQYYGPPVGGTGCPVCPLDIGCFPFYPPSEIQVVIGGATSNTTNNFNCFWTEDWTDINGTYSLTTASDATGIPTKFTLCQTWEYNGTIHTYGYINTGASAQCCDGSPGHDPLSVTGYKDINKLQVFTYLSRDPSDHWPTIGWSFRMYNEDGKIMSETSKTRRIIDSRQAGVTVGEKMIHANAFPFQFIQTDSPIYSCFGMKPNMTGIEIIGLAEGA